ncbi:hypothetical protein AA23498_3620 [Acetobacter nitrogenifigens DSM 23921 = NBRC 105050]|uniref:Uncharacterized protein n=1 Tax=Acetobacter nitrogenifigens DSM 23921 = NBRC 105050 TaxID=1120919 RepID=A0A511XF73_9PROT|nr:hypothetical protein [Acetobacter nitrogenifigens]GBR00136.1 hypothetical protein AA23498_3620 [Acetobacter nitrogenifigens DSM 23921 = NBRC 105050]GEN61555.1 hypothetical protein ANI02nite_34390 [Acetobacter nitrogenifigens DSM 23921 = NBRC 105050]
MTEESNRPFGRGQPDEDLEISDAAWRARLIATFRSNSRAQMIWRRHAPDSRLPPRQFVACTDGMSDLAGVVIGGDALVTTQPAAWDTDGTFTMLADDGCILTVNGWMSTAIAEEIFESEELTMDTPANARFDSVFDLLVLKAGLARMLAQSPAAKSFWDIHLKRLGAAPGRKDRCRNASSVLTSERILGSGL